MKKLAFLLSLLPALVFGQDLKVIAHRGGAGSAPENTLAAFQNAVAVQADYFELDVAISSDDSLMIMHDATVDRTTDGSGTVSAMTYQQLRQLDAGSWFGPEFAGERIPTLRESLMVALESPHGTGVVIEIKSSDTNVPGAVVAMVQELGMQDRVIVSSFDLSQITTVKSLDPTIPVQLFATVAESHIDQVEAIGGEWVGSGGEITESLVDYAHSKGISFNAWTLNSAETMLPAIQNGVDAITTDYPEIALLLDDDTEPSDVVLTSATPEETRIKLKWEAAVDNESGIVGYDIFRDVHADATTLLVSLENVTEYVDETYMESTPYYYRVKARNLAGLSSLNYSNEIQVSTLSDITPPGVKSILSRGDSTTVVVVFTERIGPESAANASNYTLDQDATVVSAQLALDQRSVILTTSPLSEKTYRLSIENVTDQASTPNPMSVEIYEFDHTGLPANAVAFYRLDSLYFSDPNYLVRDDTENHNTGTNHGGVSLTEGILGNALAFNGVDGYVNIPASASLNISGNAVTLSLWAKLPARPTQLSSAYAPLFDSETDNYVLYGDRGNSELRFKVSTSGGAERPGIPDADIPVNEWIHVVGVYDGANAMVYLNGELKDSHPLTGTVNAGQVATIGKTGSVYLEGALDQVEVYNRALSAEEINEIYSYYSMKEGLECPEITVTLDGIILTSDTEGDSYQWLNCDQDHAVIPGETNRSFTPEYAGNYAVIVTGGGCTDTSGCVYVENLGLGSIPAGNLRIYPNPSQGMFTLDLSAIPEGDCMLHVITASGKKVFERMLTGGREQMIDLSGEQPGLFMLRLVSGEHQFIQPVVIL